MKRAERVLAAMAGRNMTAPELAEVMGLCNDRARELLREVRVQDKAIHIAEWRIVHLGRHGTRLTAVLAPGAGEDAPRPESARERREKQKVAAEYQSDFSLQQVMYDFCRKAA